mmetsp:Transcript_19814/g.46894  ORF Transcript_19814/g.46894 Transcript_19814/m.46894 type:complete len:84 (-) Transcript_19814:200-451(-)
MYIIIASLEEACCIKSIRGWSPVYKCDTIMDGNQYEAVRNFRTWMGALMKLSGSFRFMHFLVNSFSDVPAAFAGMVTNTCLCL